MGGANRLVVGRRWAAAALTGRLVLCPRELAAGGEDVALAPGGVEFGGELPVAVDAAGELLVAVADASTDVVGNDDVVALLDLGIRFLVDRQRDDPEVEQVRTVNPREALGEDGFDAEIHRT